MAGAINADGPPSEPEQHQPPVATEDIASPSTGPARADCWLGHPAQELTANHARRVRLVDASAEAAGVQTRRGSRQSFRFATRASKSSLGEQLIHTYRDGGSDSHHDARELWAHFL